MFAQVDLALLWVSIVFILLAVGAFQLYMLLYHPETYRQMKEHEHQRAMQREYAQAQKREQRGQMLGVAGKLLAAFWGRHRY